MLRCVHNWQVLLCVITALTKVEYQWQHKSEFWEDKRVFVPQPVSSACKQFSAVFFDTSQVGFKGHARIKFAKKTGDLQLEKAC